MRIHELDGHTCCPEATLVKAVDPEAYHMVAARNLAIVGRSGLDMVTPCNGCYSTFKETQRHMSAAPAERAAVEGKLATEDLTWSQGLQVLHLAEWLADVEGAPAVARRAVRSLAGMRVAVHYGCHLLRPQPAVSWDDPLQPSKVETLVRALGARVVDYPSKMQCCGGALDRVGERETSLSMARSKLLELGEPRWTRWSWSAPAASSSSTSTRPRCSEQARTWACPFSTCRSCSPSLRHDAADIGLGMHRVSVEPFLARGTSARRPRRARQSSTCGCSRSATPAAPAGTTALWQGGPGVPAHRDHRPDPRRRLEGVLADGQAWKCLECYTCLELCPSRIGLAGTLRVLKEHGAARDGQPDPMRAAYDLFLETACWASRASPRAEARPRTAACGRRGCPRPNAQDRGRG